MDHWLIPGDQGNYSPQTRARCATRSTEGNGCGWGAPFPQMVVQTLTHVPRTITLEYVKSLKIPCEHAYAKLCIHCNAISSPSLEQFTCDICLSSVCCRCDVHIGCSSLIMVDKAGFWLRDKLCLEISFYGTSLWTDIKRKVCQDIWMIINFNH